MVGQLACADELFEFVEWIFCGPLHNLILTEAERAVARELKIDLPDAAGLLELCDEVRSCTKVREDGSIVGALTCDLADLGKLAADGDEAWEKLDHIRRALNAVEIVRWEPSEVVLDIKGNEALTSDVVLRRLGSGQAEAHRLLHLLRGDVDLSEPDSFGWDEEITNDMLGED